MSFFDVQKESMCLSQNTYLAKHTQQKNSWYAMTDSVYALNTHAQYGHVACGS